MAALERKRIDDLTDQELAVYGHAIRKLLDDPNAATNYQHHADFHNVFSQNPPRGCEHRNDLFFPWHRYHLLNFERALQLSDPDHPTLSTRDVTIPFWDWTSPPQSGVRYPAAFENAESPLFNEERNSDASGPMFSAEYMTRLIRENPDWHVFAGGPKGENEFFGAFESPSHNDMHSEFIGGLMGDPQSAAEDPIYWSFHAFIDRIWERWRQVHDGESTCLQCTLRGFPGQPTASEVQRTENGVALPSGQVTLGYFYAFDPTEVERVLPPSALTPHARFAAMLADPATDTEELFQLEPGPQPLTFRIPQIAATPNRAALWLVKLRPPVDRSYRLSAFVHPEGTGINPGDPIASRSYHVGDFSFWKAHHLLPGQTAGAVLPVTAAFRRYAEDGARHQLTLVLRALDEASSGNHHHSHEHNHVHGGDEQLQFEGVALQLNGNGVPNIALGEVPRNGR